MEAATMQIVPERGKSDELMRSVLESRLRSAVEPHLDAVWLFVRRLGIAEADVDDLVQEAVVVLAKRLPQITPGSERSFLFSTAYRMSADARKKRQRRNEVGDDLLEDRRDSSPDASELYDQQRALEALDALLEAMPTDLRAVFVLYELEEHTMGEIAVLLDIASGTVASRLRRARQLFAERFEHFKEQS